MKKRVRYRKRTKDVESKFAGLFLNQLGAGKIERQRDRKECACVINRDKERKRLRLRKGHGIARDEREKGEK